MSVILIANVGVRDLRYNVMYEDEPLFLSFDFKSEEKIKDVADVLGCEAGARHIAEKILEKGEQELKKLTFPILKPAIQYVLERHDFISRVVLIVTDQDKERAPKHWPNDTINSGKILKILVEKHFKEEVKTIDSFAIKEMPASHDRAYEFFGENLPRIIPSKPKALYVILSPGIPALKDALMAQALSRYYDKCHICQVIEPKEGDLRRGLQDFPDIAVQKIHIDPLLRDMVLRSIVGLIQRYDYSGALTTVKKFESQIKWDPGLLSLIKAILNYAHNRFNFAYKEANVNIRNFIETDSSIRKWYTQSDEAIRNKGNRYIRLKDAIFTSSICLKTEQYAEMLWRVASFYDIAEEMTKEQSCYDSLEDKFKKLDSIKKVRNKTIHKLIGVSEADLNKAWSGWKTELVSAMEEIFTGLSKKEKYQYPNSYEEINHRIMQLFRKL